MPPLKLIWSNLSNGKVRTALTAAAIGLSISLVVAVTSGYASVESAALAYLNRYLGSADAEITRPQSLFDGLIVEHLSIDLMNDPDVHRVTGRLEAPSVLFDKDGKQIEHMNFSVTGLRRPEDSRIDSLKLESGRWFDASVGNFAVVDQVAAEALNVKVGDSFYMGSVDGRRKFEVVGIVHKPELMAAAIKTVYVPLETLQVLQNVKSAHSLVSRIAIDLNTGANADAFAARWTKTLAKMSDDESKAAGHPVAPMKLRMVRQDQATMDMNMSSIHVLTYLGDAISMLAATFIIFSSLSMGVTERQRTLATLRALGATRLQVAGVVIGEGIAITALGAAGGVPLGLFWTEILRVMYPDNFIAGITVSMTGVCLAAAGALAAAMGASMLPAWLASRVAPLEAMSPLAGRPASGPVLRWAGLGLLLILIDPVIFDCPWEKLVARLDPGANVDALTTLCRFWAHYSVGAEGVFVGFFLLSPLLIWLVERFVAPALAWLLGLPSVLLRQQLSHGRWRAAGAAAALMVGLAALIVLTTQGTSMLQGWKLPDKFPDIFLVSLRLGGVSAEQWKALGESPQIRRFDDGTPQLLPVAVTVSGLGSNPLALVGAVLAPQAGGTMFFGVPPKQAFEMMELDFRDDDGRPVPRDQEARYAQRAEQELELGRHVIVTEDYRRLHHVRYGSTIALLSDTKKYEYTVCGIVWSPGLDVIVAMFDMGKQLDQRTVGMVLGSLDDAKKDFGADHVNLFAANLVTGVDKAKLMDDLHARLGDLNMRAGDVRQIKAAIVTDFRDLMALLTTVAFGAMGVASMGVTNTIMASVRSRQWQFGILRGIGLRRADLLKLVLCESLLLGGVGLLMGLGCGTLLAMDVRELGAEMLGYLPPLVIPWGYIALGSMGVVFVSVAAALWPAISISRTQPLTLLQAGRAAT